MLTTPAYDRARAGHASGAGPRGGRRGGRGGPPRGDGPRVGLRCARRAISHRGGSAVVDRSGRHLMMAGAIVTVVGLGIILVRELGIPRYWMPGGVGGGRGTLPRGLLSLPHRGEGEGLAPWRARARPPRCRPGTSPPMPWTPSTA